MAKLRMNKARALRKFVLFLMASSILLYYRWQFHSADQPVEDVTKYEYISNQQYARDYRGYLYPKGYFKVIPKEVDEFRTLNMKGQHSDAIFPECTDPQGVDPGATSQKYGLINPPKYLPNYKNPCWYDEDNRLSCLPYFYVIGMAKSGSTDLFSRILKHHQIAEPKHKEYRWFDRRRFNTQTSSFKYYHTQMRMAADKIEKNGIKDGYHQMVFGEGSVSYSWDNIEWMQLPENQHCLEPRVLILSNIHHLTPNAKLILLLRNPVDRLYSHYLYHSDFTKAKCTPQEFHEWVVEALNAYKDCFKTQPFRACIYSKEIKEKNRFKPLPSSMFSRIILDILKIFPREQLFIMQTEDYSTHMKERMQDVFDFLGLDRAPDLDMERIAMKEQKNKGWYYKRTGPMLNETRKILEDFYRPFNQELALMLNHDKYLWPKEE